MRERKYENYELMITFLNGDTEKIKLNGVNTNNYKEVLEVYKNIKEQYQDQSVTISFTGISSNGEIGILFTKKIVSKETKQKEYADKVANTSVDDMLGNLKDDIKLIIDKYNRRCEQYSILDKSENIQLHKIESFNEIKWDSKEAETLEKIKIFDTIQEITRKRRVVKRDIAAIQKIKTIIKLDEVYKSLDKIKTNNDKKYTYLSDEKVEEFKIMKEVTYKNFKERVKLIGELSKEFDKVYFDDHSMKITCYNRAV